MPAYFENGVFTDGKAAWHGAGVVLPDESLSLGQVFELVPELASNVVQTNVYSVDPLTGLYKQVPGQFANVREFDGKPLGIVGSRYKILQNVDAFQFVADIVDSGDAIIKTAGTLKGGAVVWFLCKIPNDIEIGGLSEERIETYLLISNSHDGSKSVTVAVVNVRVVCSNTLAAALGGAQRTFKIRHTQSVGGKVNEARRALDVSFKFVDELQQVGDQLLNSSISDAEFEAFLKTLVPDVNDKEGKPSKRPGVIRNQIRGTYNQTDDLANIRGTKWGVLQALTAWTDHKANYKSSSVSTKAENRFANIVSGQSLASRGAEILVGSL